MLRDAVHPNNVLGAIAYYKSVLAWPSSSNSDRVKALKFLVHYVADIHQPMHVSRAADKGGNDIKVRFFGRATASGGGAYNLHNVWDTHLIARANLDWHAYTETLFDGIGAAQRESWARSDPADWARESFAYALERCYAPVSESTDLGEAYFAANRPIVELRLQQGGVRLASLLSKVLAK